jgi:hypothetical protein
MAQNTKDFYTIPEENLEKLEADIAKLNKRALKLGVDPVEVKILDTERKPAKDPRNPNRNLPNAFDLYYHVEVIGQPIKLGDYQFIGTLERMNVEDGQTINLTKSVPGEELPVELRDISPERCDHCHLDRNRKKSFVLRNNADTSEYKVVGSNCLRDFTGHDAEYATKLAEYMFRVGQVAGGYEGNLSGYVKYDLTEFMEAVAAIVRLHKWVGRGKAKETGETSTAIRAWSYIERSDEYADYKKNIVTQEDKDRAAKVLEWGENNLVSITDPKELSEYRWNLRTIASSGFVDIRTIGYAASLFPVAEKEMGFYDKMKQNQVRTAKSEFVGTLQEREEFKDVEVVFIKEYFNTYKFNGKEEDVKTTYVRMIYNDQDSLLWKCTTELPIDLKTGETPFVKGNKIDIKGTVKKHEVTKYGEKQTVLQRVALLQELEQTAPAKKTKKTAVKATGGIDLS